MPVVAGVLLDNTGVLQMSTGGTVVGIAPGRAPWPVLVDGTVAVAFENSQARTINAGFAFDVNGRLIVDGNAVPAAYSEGLPVSVGGALCIDATGTIGITSYSAAQGLTAGGKVAANQTLNQLATVTRVDDGLTPTTGQTDPFGGSTAWLETDTAANVLHRWYDNSQTVAAGQKYLCTLYWKPGTMPNGISFETFDTTFSGYTISNAGVLSAAISGASAGAISSVANGFFKITWIYTVQGAASLFFVVNFGQNGQSAYLGSVQNHTFAGVGFQRLA